MTQKKKILELLKNNTLKSSQISEETGIDAELVYVYLNRLLKKNKIIRTNDTKPYLYRTVLPLDLLDQLYTIMINKMKPTKKLTDGEMETLKIIEEVLENA